MTVDDLRKGVVANGNIAQIIMDVTHGIETEGDLRKGHIFDIYLVLPHSSKLILLYFL